MGWPSPPYNKLLNCAFPPGSLATSTIRKPPALISASLFSSGSDSSVHQNNGSRIRQGLAEIQRSSSYWLARSEASSPPLCLLDPLMIKRHNLLETKSPGASSSLVSSRRKVSISMIEHVYRPLSYNIISGIQQ